MNLNLVPLLQLEPPQSPVRPLSRASQALAKVQCESTYGRNAPQGQQGLFASPAFKDLLTLFHFQISTHMKSDSKTHTQISHPSESPTMPSCPPTTALNPQTYNNTCVLAASSPDNVKSAFNYCCTNETSTVTSTSCYDSCKIDTNVSMPISFGFSIQFLDPPVTIHDEDFTCFLADNSSSPLSSSTAAGVSASKTASSPSGSSATASPSASSKKASDASVGRGLSAGIVAIIGLVVFGLMV